MGDGNQVLAQSIRFWSPDSRYLIYSDQESSGQVGVWIADAQGQEAPRRLAEGTLAVWSWRETNASPELGECY